MKSLEFGPNQCSTTETRCRARLDRCCTANDCLIYEHLEHDCPIERCAGNNWRYPQS